MKYIVISPVGNGKGYCIKDFIEKVKAFEPAPHQIVLGLHLDHGFDLTDPMFEGITIVYDSCIDGAGGSLERICSNREVLRLFFVNHKERYEHALWIDTDIMCPPETPAVLHQAIVDNNVLIAVNKVKGRGTDRYLCGSGMMFMHRIAATVSRFYVGIIEPEYVVGEGAWAPDGLEKHLSEDFMFFAMFDQGRHFLDMWCGMSGRLCDHFVEVEHIFPPKRY
jgi:hypothetical protein